MEENSADERASEEKKTSRERRTEATKRSLVFFPFHEKATSLSPQQGKKQKFQFWERFEFDYSENREREACV